MKHRVKKIKFQFGKDANKMLMRKLALNFISHGKMQTTETKAKVLKSYLDKLLQKTKERTEANKNYLLHHFSTIKIVNKLFDEVGPMVKERTGGYTRITRLQERSSDGTLMAQLEWSIPMVAAPVEPVKTEEKTAKSKVKKVKQSKEEEKV